MCFAFGAANIDKKINNAFLFAIFVQYFLPFIHLMPWHNIRTTLSGIDRAYAIWI